MKKTTQYIILFLLIQVCYLNGFSKTENDFNKNRDSIETYVLEIINPQIFKIIDFIDSTSQNCLFYKENIPYHKMISFYKDGNITIEVVLDKFCAFFIPEMLTAESKYNNTNNCFIGYFIYNGCYHYVIDQTDSLSTKYFNKKEKCILWEFSESKFDEKYFRYNRKFDILSFYYKNINDTLFYISSYDCYEFNDQIPSINSIDDITFKTPYSEHATNLIIINSPYFKGFHNGYATLEIEFDNIKQMNVIRLIKCKDLRIYDKNECKFNYCFDGLSTNYTAEERLILQSLLTEIEKKIMEVDFYVLNKPRWYDKIIKPKKKRNNSISRIENVDINLVINPKRSE